MVGVSIHPSAVVESGAELGSNVSVGPFCFIGSGVQLGDDSQVMSHVTLLGPARFGAGCRFFPHATLGAAPQDRSYNGADTELVVGNGVTFREQVTVHRGTEKGGGTTRIDDGCLLMVGAHVAHDCRLHEQVLLTNLTTLGGHVNVAARATLGGQVVVAPFVKLGRLCFVAGGARVERDVPPFLIAQGDRARVRGLNRVGLERAGIAQESINALRAAYKRLYAGSGSFAQALELLGDATDPLVAELVAFLRQRQ